MCEKVVKIVLFFFVNFLEKIVKSEFSSNYKKDKGEHSCIKPTTSIDIFFNNCFFFTQIGTNSVLNNFNKT